MSFKFADKEDRTPCPSRGPLPTSPKPNSTYVHATRIRTFPVLDAIAGISVTGVRAQVVSVALQLDNRTQQVRLTIAANQIVKVDLVNHLTTIWGRLQAISNEYMVQTLKARGSDLYGGRSLGIPTNIATPLKVAMFREIYQFCMGKQIKRMQKWLSGITSLLQQLTQRRGDKPLRAFELNLYRTVVGLLPELQLLQRLYDHPQAEPMDDAGVWEEMYEQSMQVAKRAELVLADTTACEILARNLTDITLVPPPICIKLNWRTVLDILRHTTFMKDIVVYLIF